MLQRFLYAKLPQAEDLCNMCFSKQVEKRILTYEYEVKPPSYIRKKSMLFRLCEDCEYSFCKENFKDYLKLGAKSISSAKKYRRVGDGVTPGREFYMASESIDILLKNGIPSDIPKREKLRILIFAPGNSLDHQLLRNLETVTECKITDLYNFQNSEYFVPIETKEKFDIVVACEVVEHFMRPRKEFSNLFRYLSRNGMLIISTDTRQHKNFSQFIYPFLYGHTSYYSEKSLIFLAQMNNMFVDFRVPKGKVFNSKSKRFIYMTKSESLYSHIVKYFSRDKHPVCE